MPCTRRMQLPERGACCGQPSAACLQGQHGNEDSRFLRGAPGLELRTFLRFPWEAVSLWLPGSRENIEARTSESHTLFFSNLQTLMGPGILNTHSYAQHPPSKSHALLLLLGTRHYGQMPGLPSLFPTPCPTSLNPSLCPVELMPFMFLSFCEPSLFSTGLFNTESVPGSTALLKSRELTLLSNWGVSPGVETE